MSLRRFHLIFLLCAMIGADLFGAWCVWQYHAGAGGVPVLLAGVVSFMGGLGLALYSGRLVDKLDEAHVT